MQIEPVDVVISNKTRSLQNIKIISQTIKLQIGFLIPHCMLIHNIVIYERKLKNLLL